MSIAAVKTYSLWRRIYTYALLAILGGCGVSGFHTSELTWKTYSNSRYGFEFPYPSNWTALPTPDNGDGVAFVAPQTTSVEIRGWAGKQLLESHSKNQDTKTTINPNFQTAQGVRGVLIVEADKQITSMTLTLAKGRVQYYWQGRSQTEEFANYYNFFNYIAQQYRIPQ